LAARVGAESVMARLKRIEIGLGAAKAIVGLITLLTVIPAYAQSSQPSATVRASCFVGKNVTVDEQIAGCTAVIAAESARTKDRAGAYLIRGADYLTRNEMDRAIADFSELIRIDSKSSAAFINRGEAYRRKGELDLAIADLDRAIAIKRRSPSAWFNRGITYSDKGDYGSALADYNQAIALNPKFALAYFNRGNNW
jgi:tetratricopeptide (TPR) repeat protein